MSLFKLSGLIELKDGFSKTVNDFDKQMRDVSDLVGDVGKEFNKLDAIAVGVIGGLTVAAWKGAESYENWQNEIKKLDTILQSTNGRIGLSSSKIQSMAEELDKTTKFTKEQAIASLTFLATQDKISGSIAERALPAIAGLATLMGGDMKQSTQQLSKALQDPKNNLDALKKAGIEFSDQEKSKIIILQNSNKLLEAQDIILGKLESGGISKLAKSSKSVFDQFYKSINGLSEALGQGLMPVFEAILTPVTNFFNLLGGQPELVTALATGIGFFAAALVGLKLAAFASSTAVKTLTFAIRTLNASNPLGWIILGISAIVSLIVYFATLENAGKKFGIMMDQVKLSIMKGLLMAKQAINANTEALEEDIEYLEHKIKLEKEALNIKDKPKTENTDDPNKGPKTETKELETELQKMRRLRDQYQSEQKNNIEDLVKSWVSAYGKISDAEMDFLMKSERESKQKTKRDLQWRMEDEKEFGEYYREKELVERETNKRSIREEQRSFTQKRRLRMQYNNASDRLIDQMADAEDEVIKKKEADELQKFKLENDIGDARLNAMKGGLDTMSQLQQVHNKKAFEVGKAAAIVQTTITTYQNAVAAFGSLAPIPIVGPVLGAAAAAAAIAFGLQQISTIKSQEYQYAGGGFAGIAPGTYQGASMGPDNMTASLRKGELVANARQQKELWEAMNGQGRRASNNYFTDNSTINITLSGNVKENRKMIEEFFEERERKKARKDQFVRGRR